MLDKVFSLLNASFSIPFFIGFSFSSSSSLLVFSQTKCFLCDSDIYFKLFRECLFSCIKYKKSFCFLVERRSCSGSNFSHTMYAWNLLVAFFCFHSMHRHQYKNAFISFYCYTPAFFFWTALFTFLILSKWMALFFVEISTIPYI